MSGRDGCFQIKPQGILDEPKNVQHITLTSCVGTNQNRQPVQFNRRVSNATEVPGPHLGDLKGLGVSRILHGCSLPLPVAATTVESRTGSWNLPLYPLFLPVLPFAITSLNSLNTMILDCVDPVALHASTVSQVVEFLFGSESLAGRMGVVFVVPRNICLCRRNCCFPGVQSTAVDDPRRLRAHRHSLKTPSRLRSWP